LQALTVGGLVLRTEDRVWGGREGGGGGTASGQGKGGGGVQLQARGKGWGGGLTASSQHKAQGKGEGAYSMVRAEVEKPAGIVPVSWLPEMYLSTGVRGRGSTGGKGTG